MCCLTASLQLALLVSYYFLGMGFVATNIAASLQRSVVNHISATVFPPLLFHVAGHIAYMAGELASAPSGLVYTIAYDVVCY